MNFYTKAQINFFTRISNDSLQGAWAMEVKHSNIKNYTFGGSWDESTSWLKNNVDFSVFNNSGELESISRFTGLDTISYYPSNIGALTNLYSTSFYAVGSNRSSNYSEGIIYRFNVDDRTTTASLVSSDSSIILRQITISGGYVYTLGQIADSFNLDYADVILSKYDTMLNLIWQRKYQWGGIELAGCIRPTLDSGIIFGCTTGPYLQWFGRVVKVRENGDLVYDKQLPIGLGEVFLMDYDQNSEDIVVMSYQYTTQGFNGTELYYLNLTKVDSNMNIVWNKQWYALAYFPTITIVNNIRNIIKVEDKYVFCGDSGGEAWVFMLNSDGTKVWEAKYGYLKGVNYGSYINYYVSGIDTLPDDKGYVISGSTNDTLNRQVAFIMSIDKDGCFSNDTCEAKQYVSVTYYAPAIRAQVFPNPFNNNLQIKIENAQLNDAELIITDLLGRTVAREKLRTELTNFDTQDWANGMYVWSLVEDGLVVKSGKVVKE